LRRDARVLKVKISAIIPTLNEEALLPRLLGDLNHQGAEVIVADGGSKDQTAAIARRFGARVLTVPAGRGRQLNAGASISTGEALFFVHADSITSHHAVTAIAEVLGTGRFVGGAFSVTVRSARPSVQFIYRMANWRSRRLFLPYGDQGIFCLRSVFRALGGYREIPLMEDVDFIRRLRRLGRTVILPQTMTTSVRRLEQEGIAYSTLRNITLAFLFLMGVSPYVLQKYYPHVR
jgi:rSAM/selenodomain-associated transferase 2